jgi:hypothetical protein
MFGLIFTTQIVSYPMFLKVKSTNFKLYHKHYVKKISFIVMPLMVLELIVATLLVYMSNSIIINLIFFNLMLIFLSTYFIQVPIHEKIKTDPNEKLLLRLVRTNWIRTLLWMVKCILSIRLLLV